MWNECSLLIIQIWNFEEELSNRFEFWSLKWLFCDNMFSLIFIDMQKEEIPDFLIQGKDQEGFEERYINDFIGKYFSGLFQCT